jgi:hypothetical protein
VGVSAKLPVVSRQLSEKTKTSHFGEAFAFLLRSFDSVVTETSFRLDEMSYGSTQKACVIRGLVATGVLTRRIAELGQLAQFCLFVLDQSEVAVVHMA